MKITAIRPLFALAALAFAGCAGTQQPEVASPASEPQYPSVQLISWSDFHSSIYEAPQDDGSALGGLPVFMAAVEKAKGDGLSMLVDGGDMFQGAMPFNAAKGMGMIEVMNNLGIDVASLGNHEFDYGPNDKYPNDPRGALKDAIESSKFPWVTSNVVATSPDIEWPYPNLKPYTFIQKGPYKIAVVGVLAMETPIATTAAHVVGLDFQNPAKTLEKYIPEIVAQKPDFLIVNAHITGLPTPLPETGATVTDVPFDGEIAEILALPDDIKQHIDLILSGHSHKSFIAHEGNLTVIQSLSAGREFTTMTLQGDKDGLHLVRDSVKKHVLSHEPLDVSCGQEKIALHPVKVEGAELMPSQAGADIVSAYEAKMTENRCDVIGCLDTSIPHVYEGECALGNLVTDAMRAHFPQSDVAMINAGGIRIDMPKGSIYRENLNALMPFDNYLYLVEISGSDLLRALKVSSSLKHGTTQVSGIKYQIEAGCSNPEDINGDGNVDNWENNCLCDGVLINGQPIDPAKTYKLAISDFMLNGGDDHAGCFNSAKTIEEGPVVKKTMLDYVQAHEGCFSIDTLKKADSPRLTMGSCGGKFAK
ncbi:MAG: bifunctional metallophosphatase/5'-nucleotidase [Proteobacteria bacterium]|nr:bifunctional metallophosphatase/5'-nucleotidase [Pseudomonadota bacterium]